MKRLIIIPCFFLILIITAIALANPDRFSIIRPADHSVVEGELIPIVIKFSRDVDAITIAKNNDEVAMLTDVKGMEYVCKTVKLNFGPNEIVVSALENGRVVESKKAAVFYRSDISMKFMNSPPEFQKKPFHKEDTFHKEDNERACLLCHDMEISVKDLKPQKPGDSVCFPCHKKITEYDYVHGPAARWDCLSCHEQNSKPLKYITRQPEIDSCFVCHKDKKTEWTPKKYLHGPIVAGKCSICHNPHASAHISRLKKPSFNLCIGCHEGFESGKHVIAGFIGSTHPTKGRPDPLRPGKELSCASCHNPHAGNSREHFQHGVISRGSLCKMCHKDRK
jgi:predicted CXXCH cytochrome family protein